MPRGGTKKQKKRNADKGSHGLVENEQADKRRYSQTCLAKPNSQARTGAKKFFPVQLTINRIGNLTELICTLLYVMTTHTC